MLKSGSKAFGIADNVSDQWDPGSYVTYHGNRLSTTSSRGERLDVGTNATIEIYDLYLDPSQKDPNRENNQSCQSPIIPFKTSKPFGYKSHKSSFLLGNASKGRKSNKYYKYKEYFIQTSSLY